MKIKCGLFIILLLFFIPCFSQENIRGEGKQAEARSEALRWLSFRQVDSIQIDIRPYAEENNGLSINEVEQLLLIKGDYDELLIFLAVDGKLNTLRESLIFNRPAPWTESDDLNAAILEYLQVNKTALQNQIDRSELREVDKAYLKLLLLYHILIHDFCDQQADNELVYASRSFLRLYPFSGYDQSINYFFNQKYYPSPFGFGFYFQTGGMFPTGNLQNYMPPGVLINMGISFHIGRVSLSGGFGPGFTGGELRQDLYYQKQWREGDELTYATGEAFVGYDVISRNRLGVTPFVGIFGAGLTPSSRDDREYYEEVENLVPALPVAAGLHVDYRFKHSDCNTKSLYSRGSKYDRRYYSARFTLGYSTANYDRIIQGMDGNMLFVKVGITGRRFLKSRENFRKKQKAVDF